MLQLLCTSELGTRFMDSEQNRGVTVNIDQ
jgi:hypothetical protein